MAVSSSWQPLDIGGIASLLTGVVTAIGIFLAYVQLRRAAGVQRAQFLLDTTKQYFGDADGRRLYYDIDYDRFKLTFVNGEPSEVSRGDAPAKPFIRSNEERLLDALLYTLDSIGRIVELGVLTGREAALFRFQARRVFDNADVKRFLEWLDKERARFGGETPAHAAGRRLAEVKNAESS